MQVMAFRPDTYTHSSKLAQGKWVKVSVAQSGIVRITPQELKRYGLDPAKARVYGYGGSRLRDRMTQDNYLDDLPQVPSLINERGITFYACGPEKWSHNGTGWVGSTNPFTTVGYYFVGEGEGKTIPQEGLATDSREYTSSFTERVFHEKDLISPAQSGHLLLGEDFRFTPSQSFKFSLTDIVPSTEVWVNVNFSANVTSQSQLELTANGQTTKGSDYVRANGDSDTYGNPVSAERKVSSSGENFTLGINFKGSGTVKSANLDNISINYTRQLKMSPASSQLRFLSSSPALRLQGATSTTHVWDITDPLNVIELKTTADGADAVKWVSPYTGTREYVAFNEINSLPLPKYVSTVVNQNLHALPVPDMVIVTTKELSAHAEQIATLHAQSQDSLLVHVIEQSQIYNEFSSGTKDVAGIRKMLKMFYDRSASDTTGHRLRYVLMMGRPTYDQRKLTKAAQSQKMETLPIWATDLGTNYSTSYSTDDYLAFLEDNSGELGGSDVMSIAVGRITPRSIGEADYYVRKLKAYMTNPASGQWRNQLMLLADDQDSGAHMEQTEDFASQVQGNCPDAFLNKVYVDEFDLVGGIYEKAKAKMFRLLENGTIWWNYVGHGSRETLSHEHQLSLTDLYSLYLKRPPVFYGATCTFGVWEQDEPGGTEALVMKESGGCIASICAVRPVYISQNGVLTALLGNHLFKRDAKGRFLPLGEILRQTKNASMADANKRRFVLLGDPAMRIAMPHNRVLLEKVDSLEVTEENQVTIPARRLATFSGQVVDGLGNPMKDFNGSIDVSLFDAEYSTTTHGRQSADSPGKRVTFEQQGSRVFASADSVRNGRFSIRVAMPEEISDNFRPAAFNMYARANDGREAVGCNRLIYLFGHDDQASADSVAPVIDAFYLNHQSFQSGDAVNENPMVIASVSDNVAINLSSAGIGRLMTLTLDGNKTYSDLSEFYTPHSTGGDIAYQLENISDGTHQLTLRVWDTCGNPAEKTIDFTVFKGQKPTIFDAYSDANPASIEANFFVSHNRPDAMLTVQVQVYSIGGRLEWEASQRGRADMFLSSPIKWDLKNQAGQRVSRGIYLYRVTVTDEENIDDTSHAPTITKRIAVTGA